MLKNKKIKEAEIKKRQHQKDREHQSMGSNSDIRILQHTINVDQMPDQLSGARAAGGMHGSFMQQGGSSTHYNFQKTGSFQHNMPASILAAGSMAQAQQRRQRQQPTHHDLSASSQSSSNILHQTSARGRISGDDTAQGTRGSNLLVSGVPIQTPNGGGTVEGARSHQRRGHQKPHRPGKPIVILLYLWPQILWKLI